MRLEHQKEEGENRSERVNLHCEILEDTLYFLAAHFKNAEFGANIVLENFVLSYRDVLKKTRKRFNASEMKLIIYCMNLKDDYPALTGRHLFVIDVCVAKRHCPGVNLNDFMNKLMRLTSLTRFCLEVWGYTYWTIKEQPDGPLEMSRYISSLFEMDLLQNVAFVSEN